MDNDSYTGFDEEKSIPSEFDVVTKEITRLLKGGQSKAISIGKELYPLTHFTKEGVFISTIFVTTVAKIGGIG